MSRMVAAGDVPASVADALGRWAPDPLALVVLLAAGSAYALASGRARRRGHPHPAWCVAAFGAGMLTLAIALLTPVETLADLSFTAHMAQHLALTLAAPPLLALGAPIALALRASDPATARALTRGLRSAPVRFLANPIVGWSCFVGVPVAVHASRLFDAALISPGWHAAEHGLWVGAALVYWWPIVGVDPSPRPVSYGARLLSLLLAMPAMSFLALAIYSADAPLYAAYAGLPAPWGGAAALVDQRNAAVLMWLAGNLVLVLSIVLVAAAWKRHDDEVQRRVEARQDALAAGVTPV